MFNKYLKQRIRYLELEINSLKDQLQELGYKHCLLFTHLGLYEEEIKQHLVIRSKGGSEKGRE